MKGRREGGRGVWMDGWMEGRIKEEGRKEGKIYKSFEKTLKEVE